MKLSNILGLNARTQQFSYRFNTIQGKKIARSKIQTWRVLRNKGIPTPKVLKRFKKSSDILDFDWESLPGAFALKPSRGLGGEGIIVIKKRLIDRKLSKKSLLIPGSVNTKENEKNCRWLTTQKTIVTPDDLKLHILDILEGAYSMGSEPDVAFIQEYVGRHKAFRKFAYRGTPDIRIIVFRKVPVMAMLRLPTKESKGRANLHQGAIGVGVDIVTGITTKAIYGGGYIRVKPGTKRKLHGIKIPNWRKCLEIAVEAQIASQLNYAGVDVVMHPEKGPMIIEINSQPGLQIQLANSAGLRRRLDKIEDLQVVNAEHGVRIAQALFAERFADRVKVDEGIKSVNVWELVKIVSKDKKLVEAPAKIDTGAWRTSIDYDMAESLGLIYPENIIASKSVRSTHGRSKRKWINLSFYLAGRKIKTTASLANRKQMRVKLIIGRRDIGSFLVKFNESEVAGHDWYKSLWTKTKHSN